MGRTWVVENTWTCSSCGHVNRGRDMVCAQCGDPKEAGEAYDTSGNLEAAAVTDEALLAQARAGANWTCTFCGFQQRNALNACERCGAERAGTASDPIGGLPGAPPATPAEDPVPTRSRGKALRRVFVVLGVLGGLFVAWFLWVVVPYEVEAQVAEAEWTYTRVLLQRRTDHGSGWDETIPAEAFGQRCARRFREMEQCNPHDCNCHDVTDYCSRDCNCHQVCSAPVCSTTCSDNGNGYSTCTESCSGGGCSTECDTCSDPCGSHTECDTCWDECEVYDQWCEYDYYSWPEVDREVTRGQGSTTQWGSRFQPDPAQNQRVETTEEYRVTFARDDERWEITPESLSDYQRFRPGERWDLEVNHAGSCTPLQPSGAD